MSLIEIKVPDIGDFDEVDVIEVLVQPGDTIEIDQSLITVESDKASMEIPASHAGVVKEVKVKLGDKITEGSVMLTLEAAGEAEAVATPAADTAPAEEEPAAAEEPTEASAAEKKPAPVEAAQPAAAPTPAAPAPEESVSEPESAAAESAAQPASAKASAPAATPPASTPAKATAPATPAAASGNGSKAHASPSIRKFARELGVDLGQVGGTGPKGRITREDLQDYVKSLVAKAVAPTAAPTQEAPAGNGMGLDLLPWPSLDFSKFGETELSPLSRIKKISGPNLHRNWVVIPHVTQYDEADVTELEAFRKSSNEALSKSGVRLTILAFVIKACVSALKKFPDFNASLDAAGENLILKKYFHIGFAADTPQGLMVPVLKDADKKSIVEIAAEMGELSAQARDGKLKPTDMQGASFTISSLGGIGGTKFTPIINAPEVAILGLSKAEMKPVWDGEQFIPRLIMPLSLSYDHRVIDGASGVRFTVYLAEMLSDLRKTML